MFEFMYFDTFSFLYWNSTAALRMVQTYSCLDYYYWDPQGLEKNKKETKLKPLGNFSSVSDAGPH